MMLGPEAVSETSCDLARVARDGDGLFLGQPWEKVEPQRPPELLSDVTGLTTKTRAIQMVLGLDSATVRWPKTAALPLFPELVSAATGLPEAVGDQFPCELMLAAIEHPEALGRLQG